MYVVPGFCTHPTDAIRAFAQARASFVFSQVATLIFDEGRMGRKKGILSVRLQLRAHVDSKRGYDRMEIAACCNHGWICKDTAIWRQPRQTTEGTAPAISRRLGDDRDTRVKCRTVAT